MLGRIPDPAIDLNLSLHSYLTGFGPEQGHSLTGSCLWDSDKDTIQLALHFSCEDSEMMACEPYVGHGVGIFYLPPQVQANDHSFSEQ